MPCQENVLHVGFPKVRVLLGLPALSVSTPTEDWGSFGFSEDTSQMPDTCVLLSSRGFGACYPIQSCIIL